MKTTKTNVSDFNITNDENLILTRNEDHYNEEEEISLANADETKSKMHEAINLRGRNHKVFNDKNGIKKAFFYASPIHAFDNETRTFEEIDTSFTENDSHTHFISGKNNFCAYFSNEDNNDELFAIEDGAYRVVVSARKNIKGKNKGVKPVIRKKNDFARKEKTSIIYADIEEGIDYEYSVENDGIKENIIIKKRAKSYRYPFIIHYENVTPILEKGMTRISFISNETKEEIFFIPEPFMCDANGTMSTDVSYEITNIDSNTSYLTITADRDFINASERVFPVIIDPQIKLSFHYAMTTYSWQNGQISTGFLYNIGAIDNGNGQNDISRMYMRLNMPSLPNNPRIKKAELIFTQHEFSGNSEKCPNIGLYHVENDICIGECTPIHNENLIDYAKMDPNRNTKYSFDITTLFDQASKNELSSYNLVLKLIDESNIDDDNNIVIYSSFYSIGSSPCIVITYESSYGINSSYRVHEHDLGAFGTGSVDLQCGNLMFELNDFSWLGNRMPISIKHLYNSAIAGYDYTNNSSIGLNIADYSAMKIGHGFKLNFMQSMLPISFTHEEKLHYGYVYIDENGTETYFKKSDKCKCCDSNSHCYSLYEDIVSGSMIYDPEKHTLSSDETRYIFDAAGKLIKIIDCNDNSIDITFTSDRIASITDGAGREFGFSYNSNGFLTSITAPDSTVISYDYSEDALTGITYADDRKLAIEYIDNKPSIVSISDENNATDYKLSYTFNGNRLINMTEYGSDDSEGKSFDYSYSVASGSTAVTTKEYTDEDETSYNLIKTTYVFDDDGNVISEYSYAPDTDNIGTDIESGSNTHMSDTSKGIIGNNVNLLLDHNFEDLNYWSKTEAPEGYIRTNSYSNEYYTKYGTRAYMVQSTTEECLECGIYQTMFSPANGNYTFSAYLRIVSAFVGNLAGAYLRVIDSSGNILGESERLTQYDTEYTRLIVPFEVKTTPDRVKVEILLNGKGTVHVDAAQLENNPYATAYNAIDNSSFERGLAEWNYSSGITTSSEEKFNMNTSLLMEGSLDSIKYVSQKIYVKKLRSTRETFTLSGWAKGYGLPNHERNGAQPPLFRLRAEIIYRDATYGEYGTENYTADFSPCTEEWQFASVEFSKSKCRNVDYINVYCEYGYNYGPVYFDNIQLVRNNIETNLLESDFVIESTTVDEFETPENDDAPPAFSEALDKFGNSLTETMFNDGEFGTIYRAFKYNESDNTETDTDAGNNLIEETDARGNKTTYTVDGDTSRNEEVTDRLGNKTAYEYDDSGRTTKVTSKDANGAELANVTYAYDTFDNMTEIVRGDGMKYALAYNNFQNLESIGIEGKNEPLVRYAYKNGNGRLKQITYANGNTMKAVYNSLGQMIAEKWFDTEADAANSTSIPTAHYKYTYDSEGNIVRSIDILNEKEYNYEYDEGKIVRATEADIVVQEENIISKIIVNTIKYYYDTEGNMTKKVITFENGDCQVTYYEKHDDNTIVRFYPGNRPVTSHSKTDSFGRKVFDELQLGTDFVSRQFVYHAGKVPEEHKDNAKVKSSATTQLVSQIILSDGRAISYDYDDEERIIKVDDTIDGVVEYTYDAIGQLVTETKDGITTKFEYDNYGNITAKGVVDENSKIIEDTKITYVYGNGTWKDLLTSYNGQSITYDAQGNPTSYLGHTLTWEKGRQLKSFDSNTYTYNANGIRTSKTVDGIKHTYTLDGTKILRETWNDNTLVPLYDNEDSVCGLLYNTVPYYFIKNLQGDVIAIVDKDAKTVARYSYDAWGTPEIKFDSSECQIATVNPFRYRGYYYDEEIGLYYLQSRYYDAYVGRFINIDTTDSLLEAPRTLENNLFAYCHNNPINETDYTGSLLTSIIKKILTGVFNGFIGLLGTDFITFLYKILLVDSNTKLVLSSGS